MSEGRVETRAVGGQVEGRGEGKEMLGSRDAAFKAGATCAAAASERQQRLLLKYCEQERESGG